MKSKKGTKKASNIAQQLELLNYTWNTSIEEIILQEDPSVFEARRTSSAKWQTASETDYTLMSGGEDTPENPDSYYITPEELEGFWGSRAPQRGNR
jgi:hypothetical protein